MWRRRRGKAKSRERGEKRREEREHLSRRTRLNLKHQTFSKNKKVGKGQSSQG